MKNLDPADWTYATSYYTGTVEGAMEQCADEYGYDTLHNVLSATPRCNAESKNEYTEQQYQRLIAKGASIPAYERLGSRCDHCGADHAWGCIYTNRVTGEWVQIGHICAKNYFSLPDKAALARKRAEQRVAAAARNRKAIREGFRCIIKAARRDRRVIAFLRCTWHKFAASLRQSAFVWGWTEKQEDAVVNAAIRFAEGQAAKAAQPKAPVQAAPTAAAPEGRVTVVGVVMYGWLKSDAAYGDRPMMKVADDRGFHVICSAPAALLNAYTLETLGTELTRNDSTDVKAFKGRRVSLVVACIPSKDFGVAWGKRPTKAKFLTTPQEAQS